MANIIIVKWSGILKSSFGKKKEMVTATCATDPQKTKTSFGMVTYQEA